MVMRSNFKIKKNDVKRVINLLEQQIELSCELAVSKLKMNENKVAAIFSMLIDNNDVINLSSKTELRINKKQSTSYKTLDSIKSDRFKYIKITFAIIAGLATLLGLNELIDNQFDFNCIDWLVSQFSDSTEGVGA